MHFRIRLGVVLVSALSIGLAPARETEDRPLSKIEDLTWLAGDWEIADPTTQVEEHWIRPAGGAMLGVGRTIRGGKMAFFEFLRIETRANDIFYVAQPRGGDATSFRLVRVTAQSAVFENLEHDFPKRILYARTADGGLDARIEGDGTEKEKPHAFHYRSSAKK